MQRVVAVLIFALALGVSLGACKRKPADLEVWRPRVAKNGQEKLTQWVGSDSELLETRIRAAEILIEEDCAYSVKLGLDNANETDRAAIVKALVPIIHGWYEKDDATVDDYQRGSSKQVDAKEGAYQLLAHASGADRDLLEKDLVDWVGGGEFRIRDQMGNVKIEQIAEALGAPAHEALLKHLEDPENPQAALARILRKSKDPEIKRKTALALKTAALKALSNTEVEPEKRLDKDLETAILEEEHEAIVPLFIRVVPDETLDPTLRTNAMDRISKIKGKAALPIFLGWIEKRPGDLRWLAVQGAAESGGKAALAPILNAFPAGGEYGGGEKDGFSREAGRFCMVEVKEEMKDVEPILLTTLKSGTPPAKAVALRCLQEVGSAKAIPAVEALGDDKTSIPAWDGAKTVGELATQTLEKLKKK